MLRFVTSGSSGLPLKRKQSQRACEHCRKRKKRCKHIDDIEDRSLAPEPPLPHPSNWQDAPLGDTLTGRPQSSVTEIPEASTTSLRSQESSLTNESNPMSNGLQDSPITSSTSHQQRLAGDGQSQAESRFIGDLNPEGIFLAAVSPTSTNGIGESGRVGVWLPRKAMECMTTSQDGLPLIQSSSTSSHAAEPMISKILLSCLSEQAIRVLPKSADFEGLSSIYFKEVDLIFPALDKETYQTLQEGSPTKNILKQAISLAAITNKGAKNYLNLSTKSAMCHKEFAEHMSQAIQTSLNLGLVRDEVVLIQVFALLSLFTQLSDNRHSSAELTARAVSYAHTTGLHLRSDSSKKDCTYINRLFCCIWALDRLNASFHGRPVLMHEHDFGRVLETCIEQQEGCFQLLLRTVLLLDKMIDLYRPVADGSEVSWETNFPPFEELLRTSGALRVKSHLLATIETFYHAVAMLSCRSQSLEESSQYSTSFVRQSLSAAKVTSIVGYEYHNQLSLFPMIPYAISLSLRVYYRDLRLSKAPMLRTRARKQLLSSCMILRDLGEIFSSAVVMVDLAEKTVCEMDKIYSSMANAQEHETTNDATTKHGVVDAPRRSGNRDETDQHNTLHRQSNGVNIDKFNFRPQADNNSIQDFSTENYDFDAFDPSIFDNLPDLDVFELFDPDFDLGAIDATLGHNINPSFPVSLVNFPN